MLFHSIKESGLVSSGNIRPVWFFRQLPFHRIIPPRRSQWWEWSPGVSSMWPPAFSRMGPRRGSGRISWWKTNPGRATWWQEVMSFPPKPDGYTLWRSTDAPFARMPHMMKLKFDPIAETTPIIFYGVFTHFVVVPADSPFKTMKDLLRLAKQNPEKLTFGNGGFGQVPHLAMAGMAIETGTEDYPCPLCRRAQGDRCTPGWSSDGGRDRDRILHLPGAGGKAEGLAVLQGEQRSRRFPTSRP